MENSRINYVELKTNDIEKVKAFYQQAFGWTFTDFGPTYTAFSNSGLEGGFELTEDQVINGALVVLYHEDLSEIQDKVVEAGAEICRPIFSFPGGRRFHFRDPAGNELAIWSDK
ncbi:VOC family protein [Flagellimonas flava]|uniref:VOC family protein n=1 Tax=Flagellimonas flava TaxID=570519 RepID=UPI003D6494F6